jgi:hypothetical protein
MCVVSEKSGLSSDGPLQIYTIDGAVGSLSGHSRSFRSISESIMPRTDLYKIV